MLPVELEKNEGGQKRHCKLCNTTLKWSDKTKNELSFPAPWSTALVTTLLCLSTQQRTLHLDILLLCSVTEKAWMQCRLKDILYSLFQRVTLRRVQCIQKRHKLILDLFNSKIKDSFVVTTILSLNTLLISLDIYYMNKMLRYF